MAVSDLKGRFRIPSYQRGFRWERRNVEQLLNDIVESDPEAPYYLQPIVVSPAPAGVKDLPEEEQYDYDLIDGQQRLTTLYLMIKAFDTIKNTDVDALTTARAKGELSSEEFAKQVALMGNFSSIDTSNKYEIIYQTRTSTKLFLDQIGGLKPQNDSKNDEDIKLICESPDHLYMWHAFSAVVNWLTTAGAGKIEKLVNSLIKNDKYPNNQARIIWYELPDSVKDWKKFTELNIGKIPLTNSELVKALLMRSEGNDITEEQKSTIIQQWDAIEKELSNPDFWGFLTARKMELYDTKIDLLFDILAQKPQNSKEDFFTFSYFERLFNDKASPKGKEKWNTIYLQYQQLRDWYLDRELYHKIGYLSTIDKRENLYQELISFLSKEDKETKSRPTNRQFRELLEKKIVDSLLLPADVTNIEELCYLTNDGSTHHQSCIHRLLTLYNVLYTHNNTKDRYDFYAHKDSKWTLEHIHAQNSEYLSKADQQREWIKSHSESLKRYLELPAIIGEVRIQLEALADEMEMYIPENSPITGKIFSNISSKYSDLIVSTDDERATHGEYEHQLDNMALLSHNENAAFNNSTFDVKRHKMLKDMSSEHIPVCTQRVFLKSIPEADDNHPYFWGTKDREAYLRDIRNVLKSYLVKVEKNSPQNKEEKIVANEA